jgi:hypothetical protein
MPRKRVIYQSEALFVGPTGSPSPIELIRVQDANYSFDIARTDVNQYGQLAAIDRVIVEQPTVSLDFSYFASSGQNEQALGFTFGASKGALTDILSGTKDVNNYYIYVSPEGTDANIDISATGTNGAQGRVIGIGNGALTSYSIEAAVGDFPKVSVAAEGLNMKFYPATTGFGPHVSSQDGSANTTDKFSISGLTTGVGYTALRPGDVLLSISGLGVNASDLKIQNFSLSTDIGRDSIQKLGSKFAFSREITFPVTVTASVEAVMGDIAGSDTLGNALSDIVCDDSKSYDLTFVLGAPSSDCNTSYTPYALRYTLKGAKLDSQSFSSSIGDNKSVTMEFSAQIGGPNDTAKGLFIENNVQSA